MGVSLTAEPDDLRAETTDDDADLPVRFRQVKDLLLTMANTVSAMKMYPSDHDTVKAFVESLTGKFEALFEHLPRLEVDIGEHSFVFADKVAYIDESAVKSLPFFFFKDGMQTLYFNRGLERQELFDFLEIVKTVAQRAGEDNDIVSALWESDFPNIQYYAPDDFLENRILAEQREARVAENLPDIPSDLAHETFEVRVDREKLAEGRIVLKPVDRGRLGRGEPAAAREESAGIESGRPAADSSLSDEELQELEDMVRDNRLLWPEEDFVNLTTEIIFLEEDPAICAASLDLLGEFLVDQVRAGQFPVANALISDLRELQSHVGPESGEKAALVDAALKKMAGPRTLWAMDAALGPTVPTAWPALLAFLRLLGAAALPTAGGLYEKWDDAEVRAKLLDFIKDAGGDDPDLVVRLANDIRPDLSIATIGLLANMPEERGLPALSAFTTFKNRNIRLEAIHALGARHSRTANRVLLGFLDDPDESLRIQAAMLLDPVQEKPAILRFIDKASAPEFRKRSPKEKQAVLSFLGRTRSPEALAFLTTVLGRAGLWPSIRNLEMRLAAVAGLAGMDTAEAWAALEKAATGRGRKVREACADALAMRST